MTRGCRQRMALFFRAPARMFFLILRGPARGEKNCAAFCRDLREFSRGRRERDGRRVRVVEWFGRKAGACRNARRQPGGGRSNPERQGFQRHRDVTLTVEMHSVPTGRWRRMSTTTRPSAGRASALTVRLHSVSSGVGGGMSASEIGMQSARRPTLTVEIHSAASRFVDGYPHWSLRISSLGCSPSPVGYTGARVRPSGGRSRRNTPVEGLSLHPHR